MELSTEEQALESLPHGDGFRFIDQLTKLDPGLFGEGQYRVKGTEPFLEAHFPGRPLVPGVILVEALAQLGGVVAQSDPNIRPMADLRLTAMKNVKIFDTAEPGELLCMKTRISGRLGNLIQVHAESRREDESMLVSAQITLSGTKEDIPVEEPAEVAGD